MTQQRLTLQLVEESADNAGWGLWYVISDPNLRRAHYWLSAADSGGVEPG